MEPSTSLGKRVRKPVFRRDDVLSLILNDSSDDEAYYEDSGSEYEVPRGKKGDYSSDSDSDLERPSTSSRSSTTSRSMPGKKRQHENVDVDLDKPAQKKGSGTSKGKGKASKSAASAQPVSEEPEPENVPRHLFDADNDNIATDNHSQRFEVESDGDWHEPHEHFGPEIPPFTGEAGITFDDTGFAPIDYASRFLDAAFWNLLVTETNRQAKHFLARNPQQKKRSLAANWEPVDVPEMQRFVGIILLMGLVRKPRFRSYWSRDPLLATPIFPAIFQRNRYEAIMKFFHFNDNNLEPPPNSPHRDRLYKVRPLLEHFTETFDAAYIPDKNICIDESLLLYKGRIIFKQYIPLKRARYGIKMFCLSDTSGYLHSFRVYSGKEDPVFNLNASVPEECADMSTTAKTTISLLSPKFLDKGYHLFIDNWYSSISLYQYLLQRNTVCTGTARSDRVPKVLKAMRVDKGDASFLCNGQLLAQKFEDRKSVYMLSTAHDLSFVPKPRHSNPDRMIPSCIADYNKNMGGVDKLDQLLEPYDTTRKTVRWYVKLGVHFIQIALLNGWCMYRSREGKHDFLLFSRHVIAKLIFPDGNRIPRPVSEDVMRLTERHFLRPIPPAQKERPTKRCRVCYKKGIKRRESRYYCNQCPSQPGLCLEGCFEDFHTKEIYWE